MSEFHWTPDAEEALLTRADYPRVPDNNLFLAPSRDPLKINAPVIGVSGRLPGANNEDTIKMKLSLIFDTGQGWPDMPEPLLAIWVEDSQGAFAAGVGLKHQHWVAKVIECGYFAITQQDGTGVIIPVDRDDNMQIVQYALELSKFWHKERGEEPLPLTGVE